MSLMCTECFDSPQFYDVNLNEEYHPYNVGACKKCEGKVVEVDDLIIDAIIVLNKKGWTTEFCCSGHLKEKNLYTYIKFIHHPLSAPHGFYKDGDCIRHEMISIEGAEGFKDLLNANLKLYKWAVRLPTRKKGESNLT